MKITKLLICLLLLPFILLSCTQESIYSKYNALSPAKYSSIEFMKQNIVRLNNNKNKITIIANYERRGKFIIVKNDMCNEGFEIIDSNSIKGDTGIVGNNTVIYNRCNISVDNSENDLVAIIPNKELTNSPVYTYININDDYIKSNDKKSVSISLSLGISYENKDENIDMINRKRNEIIKEIEKYIAEYNSTELQIKDEKYLRNEFMMRINKLFKKQIIKEIIINKMFIEK
jgi:hypothetical protein